MSGYSETGLTDPFVMNHEQGRVLLQFVGQLTLRDKLRLIHP